MIGFEGSGGQLALGGINSQLGINCIYFMVEEA